ncbi:MAG: hypothetical protein WED00_06005 [Aquisalimonadaceae bacterium]
MFNWEGQDAASACAAIAERDPRRYRIGMLTTGPWPAGPDCALQWFGHHSELAQFLLRVEPRRWGINTGELIAFKARVQDVITTVDVAGITEQQRCRFNDLSAPAFGVRWWGTLEALKQGRGAWPRELLRGFDDLPANAEVAALDNHRVADLIQFLQSQYPGPRVE